MDDITKEKWHNITNEHIIKAIEEFEHSPNTYYAARNTFLMYKGKNIQQKPSVDLHLELLTMKR